MFTTGCRDPQPGEGKPGIIYVKDKRRQPSRAKAD
jgi:hypothetical protein